MRRFWFFLFFIFLIACDSSKESVNKDDIVNKNFSWRLVTAWPPNLPINQEVVVDFAKNIETMSAGSLKIKVFAGGELVPPLQVFDAVSRGAVEMGHAASYYWAGKVPAAQFLTVVPFGMTHKGAWSWIYAGGGLEVWRELYKPFNLIPFPMGNTGIQMGGWFNKKIDGVSDLEGLKMRIPGLGGKVLAAAGGNPILLSASEIYTALERGTIDATEWVGPLHDKRFGLDRIAKYYYYPGWHEPGSQLELLINKDAWETLPKNLQQIIISEAANSSLQIFARSEFENAKVLSVLKDEGNIMMLEFPEEVMTQLKSMTDEVLEEEAAKDPMFKKVYQSYESFSNMYKEYEKVTDIPYRSSVD